MKKVILICLFTIIILIVSCKKKTEVNISSNNKTVYVSDPNNIYHKEYTNVVKIQGKYVDLNSSVSSYVSYNDREEGEYEEYDNIFDAIRNHSLNRLQELIEKEDYDVNETISTDESEYSEFMDDSYSINGATPIIFAAFYRDLGMMKYLLDKGADPFVKDNDGWNAFIWACATGNVDVIKVLVEYDPDLVNSKNPYDANGLHMAALNDNIPVFKYLVDDLGIDINSADEDGDGVLYYANDGDTIQALKDLGAEE